MRGAEVYGNLKKNRTTIGVLPGNRAEAAYRTDRNRRVA